MIVENLDRKLVQWAVAQGTPFYYTEETGLPSPCLKIHFGHITAYFHHGQLVRLWAHADRANLDEMFEQLMRAFELCGRCRSLTQYEDARGYWSDRIQASDPLV